MKKQGIKRARSESMGRSLEQGEDPHAKKNKVTRDKSGLRDVGQVSVMCFSFFGTRERSV